MSTDWSPSGFLLTGRSAIVTGCARGLGRCLAHGLAAAGAQVLACDLVGDGANAVAKDIQAAGGKAHAFPMDVTNGRAALDAVAFGVKEFGSVDVLVNNAAIDIIEPVPDVSQGELEQDSKRQPHRSVPMQPGSGRSDDPSGDG